MSVTLQAPEAPVIPPTSDDAPPPGRAKPARYHTDPSPWQRRDGLVPGVLAVAGAAVLLLCWAGASGERAWRDQIGWLVGACLGTGVVVLAAALYLLVGLREVRRAFRDLRGDQRRIFELPGLGLATGVPTVEDTTGPVPVAGQVTATGMTRAHHPDCLLMRGKPATAIAPADLDRYARCGVCDP